MKLKYKKHPSLYESYHIIWNGIDYDKEKLVKFIKRLIFLRFIYRFSKSATDEMRNMESIILLYGKEKLEKLLNNDEDRSRLSIIEKYARIGALEILTSNLLTKETYHVISNLPLTDYKLITKRTQELIKIARNITVQDDTISNDIPG